MGREYLELNRDQLIHRLVMAEKQIATLRDDVERLRVVRKHLKAKILTLQKEVIKLTSVIT